MHLSKTLQLALIRASRYQHRLIGLCFRIVERLRPERPTDKLQPVEHHDKEGFQVQFCKFLKKYGIEDRENYSWG